MQRKWLHLAVAIVATLGICTSAFAATQVSMQGSSDIMGTFYLNHNYTGWTKTGKKTEDTFQIWHRILLLTDFKANNALKFRLGLKIMDIWGHGTYTAANPSAVILVNKAYLQFKWPETPIQITAGLQPLGLPQSPLYNGSAIYSDCMAALTVKAPLIPDTLSLVAGFGRLFDTDRTYDDTTTQQADEMDAYFLTLPVTTPGFKATPWGMAVVAGKNTNYSYKNTADAADYGNSFNNAILSAASAANIAGTSGLGHWKNAQNPYFWAGGSFQVSALDPVRFYADVIYGAGAMNDSKAAQRHGWLVDFAAEYTGWTVLTPQVFAWWSTGEDKSTLNGSERMPYLRSRWGPGRTFLFEGSYDVMRGSSTNTTPVGNYGVGLSLANISFIEKLTNCVTVAYLRGNNSARAIRTSQLLDDSYMTMGHDMADGEYVVGVNLDTKYMLYENLALVLDTGWAHGNFKESVWGHRLYSQAESNGNNTWKVAMGLSYKF